MDVLTNLLGGLGANKSVFLMMGIFLAAYIISRLVGFSSISSTLVERDDRTAGREEKADHERQKFSQIIVELEGKLKGANAEVSQTFSAIRSEAVTKQNEIIKIAREKAQTEVEKARLEIARNMDIELKKIKEQSIEMSALIVQQLMVARGTGRVSTRAQREV